MNKGIFWTGLGFQSIHLLGIMVLLFASLDWSFITMGLLIGAGYIIFNIVTLVMIVMGSISSK